MSPEMKNRAYWTTECRKSVKKNYKKIFPSFNLIWLMYHDMLPL